MDSCRTKEGQAAQWREAGIPDGYRISRLFYNAAAAVIIAELRGMNDGYLAGRLVMRHTSAEKYEPIGSPAPDVAFESAATCEKEPVLLFNAMTWQRDSEGRRSNANWDGLYVFNTRTKELDLRASHENFIKPKPYDERAWITDIVGLSDDANHAYVKVGLGKHFEDGKKRGIRYDYFLARLNLKTRELELVSQLKNLWF
jgi:hypothetical protein